jgi:hypothetical protein
MRRPAIGSTPSTRLPPALGPPTAAPLVLAGALLALAVLLAVLAIAPGSPTAPVGRPAAASTGRPNLTPLRARSAQLPRRP